MNERIKQLYNQARNKVSIRDGVLTPGAIRDEFAKLIVRECAYAAVQKDAGMAYTADVAAYMAAGRSTAARMIKEHFGIEE